MDAINEGPLAGLRVIDFGQYVAGPGAAMILADQGADVVRIEPPGGPQCNPRPMPFTTEASAAWCWTSKREKVSRPLSRWSTVPMSSSKISA